MAVLTPEIFEMREKVQVLEKQIKNLQVILDDKDTEIYRLSVVKEKLAAEAHALAATFPKQLEPKAARKVKEALSVSAPEE